MEKKRHPTALVNLAGSHTLVSLAQDASEFFSGGIFVVRFEIIIRFIGFPVFPAGFYMQIIFLVNNLWYKYVSSYIKLLEIPISFI